MHGDHMHTINRLEQHFGSQICSLRMPVIGLIITITREREEIDRNPSKQTMALIWEVRGDGQRAESRKPCWELF
jgi:hypothetical protein